MALCACVTDGRGRSVTERGLAGWLEHAAPRSATGEVSVALVSDREMRRMNREFRGVDRATDVLSFVDTRSVAIARETARRQARALGHSYRTELRILALHGLLHLLGYDHETDTGQMRRVEERLRRRAGLPAGLVARAETHAPRR